FYFNDTTTTPIDPLSLHDALPIYPSGPNDYFHGIANNTSKSGTTITTWGKPNTANRVHDVWDISGDHTGAVNPLLGNPPAAPGRSEEHTSELQSRENLVCRLLLEK